MNNEIIWESHPDKKQILIIAIISGAILFGVGYFFIIYIGILEILGDFIVELGYMIGFNNGVIADFIAGMRKGFHNLSSPLILLVAVLLFVLSEINKKTHKSYILTKTHIVEKGLNLTREILINDIEKISLDTENNGEVGTITIKAGNLVINLENIKNPIDVKEKIHALKSSNEIFIENQENLTKIEKKGWSWSGFLFTPFYYAGYRKFGKAFLLLLINLIPLFGFGVNIYGGLKAKKELPVGQQPFSWSGVFGLIGVVALIFTIIMILINSLAEPTPTCQDKIVKTKLFEIIKSQTAKNASEIGLVLDDTTWKTMGLDVLDIQTISHNKELNSYECKANMAVKYDEHSNIMAPFTYTISKLASGELYIYVKDLTSNFFTENTGNKITEVPIVVSENSNINTHCNKNENIIFSCDTGNKIVSICSSKSLSGGYIQYRFGKSGTIEALIPEQAENFRNTVSAYYLNAGGTAEAKGIEFLNGDFLYGINSTDNRLYVRKNGNEIVDLTCKDIPTNNMDIELLRSFGLRIEEN